MLTVAATGGGGKISQNLADIICGRSLMGYVVGQGDALKS